MFMYGKFNGHHSKSANLQETMKKLVKSSQSEVDRMLSARDGGTLTKYECRDMAMKIISKFSDGIRTAELLDQLAENNRKLAENRRELARANRQMANRVNRMARGQTGGNQQTRRNQWNCNRPGFGIRNQTCFNARRDRHPNTDGNTRTGDRVNDGASTSGLSRVSQHSRRLEELEKKIQTLEGQGRVPEPMETSDSDEGNSQVSRKLARKTDTIQTRLAKRSQANSGEAPGQKKKAVQIC